MRHLTELTNLFAELVAVGQHEGKGEREQAQGDKLTDEGAKRKLTGSTDATLMISSGEAMVLGGVSSVRSASRSKKPSMILPIRTHGS